MIVEIIYESPIPGYIVELPKGSSTVFEKGQLGSLESNAVVHLDAAAEDATFCGVVHQGAANGETTVRMLLAGTVLIDVTSATYGFGDGLKYSAGDSSTDYSLVTDGGANTLMFSAEERTAAVTRLRAFFDVIALGKLFSNSD